MMQSQARRTIGVIGLGEMGFAMALALRDAGWHVVGFDPAESARVRAAQEVSVTDHVEGLIGVDTFLLSVPGADHVRAVVGELLEHFPGAVIVDATTSDPQTSQQVAAAADAVEAAFVDAPVSGGKTGARAGTLMAFVGGTDDAVMRAAPVLDVIAAGKWRHLGGPGAGNVGKLINNTLAAANLLIAAEAVAVGERWGIAPRDLIDALNGASGRNAATEVNLPRWVFSDAFDSGFTMALMVRDVNLARATFESAGLTSHVTSLVADRWNAAARCLVPTDDFNRVVPVMISQVQEPSA